MLACEQSSFSPPEALFVAMQENYAAGLRKIVNMLRIDRWAITTGRFGDAQAGALLTRAHRLVGSGATYRFTGISEAARGLEKTTEEVLEGLLPMELLLTQIDRVIGVIEFEVGAQGGAAGASEGQAQRQREAASVPLPGSSQTLRPAEERRKVVVVDDDPAILELVSLSFTLAGFAVEEFADGVEALSAIHGIAPDLVVLDRQLPHMSGGSVLFELKQYSRTANIPVVVISAKPQSSFFASQANHYVQKPFDVEELVATCFKAMELTDDPHAGKA